RRQRSSGLVRGPGLQRSVRARSCSSGYSRRHLAADVCFVTRATAEGNRRHAVRISLAKSALLWQSCVDVTHVGVPRYMGNIENTAVNDLIDRASGRPRATPPAGLPVPALATEPPHLALPVTMPVA